MSLKVKQKLAEEIVTEIYFLATRREWTRELFWTHELYLWIKRWMNAHDICCGDFWFSYLSTCDLLLFLFLMIPLPHADTTTQTTCTANLHNFRLLQELRKAASLVASGQKSVSQLSRIFFKYENISWYKHSLKDKLNLCSALLGCFRRFYQLFFLDPQRTMWDFQAGGHHELPETLNIFGLQWRLPANIYILILLWKNNHRDPRGNLEFKRWVWSKSQYSRVLWERSCLFLIIIAYIFIAPFTGP